MVGGVEFGTTMEYVLNFIADLLNYIIEELEYTIKYPEDYFSLEQLDDIEKYFAEYGDKNVVMVEFLRKYPVDPELVYLVVEKINSQGGVLNPMDRLFLTILKD
jgi:hypothetical protein